MICVWLVEAGVFSTATQSLDYFGNRRTDTNVSKKFQGVSTNCILLKFMFSMKATEIDEIFTVNLTVCSKCQIDSEDFVKFCSLLRKHEL